MKSRAKNLPGGDKYHWTQHVIRKMGFYGLTPSRVQRVIRHPERLENGIAPGTLAGMQKTGTPKKPTEIWAMWAEKVKSETRPNGHSSGRKGKAKSNLIHPNQKIVITAWRYPGISPVRDQIPIPADIIAELEQEGVL